MVLGNKISMFTPRIRTFIIELCMPWIVSSKGARSPFGAIETRSEVCQNSTLRWVFESSFMFRDAHDVNDRSNGKPRAAYFCVFSTTSSGTSQSGNVSFTLQLAILCNLRLELFKQSEASTSSFLNFICFVRLQL